MKIKKNIIEKMIKHSKDDAPIEACGYLASKEGVIIKNYPLTNIDQSKEHFSFSQEEQFDVLKKSRSEDLKIVAVYHSHPETPARPSEEDIKLAYDPELSYVIVSLAADQVDIKSFKIRDSKVNPETIEVIDEHSL